MPPKAKITREMVIDAAFEVARADGAENINARTVAKKLSCSTQPVMYHFATIEELKKAAYKKADEYHSGFLINIEPTAKDLMLEIGLNYIRFAVKEPRLFSFLFQSGYVAENNMLDIINSEEIKPVISIMQERMGVTEEQTKEVFITLAMFVHGYASIIANNSLEYDEKLIIEQLNRVYKGAVLALKEDLK